MSHPTLADFTVGGGALASVWWWQALADAEPYLRAFMLLGGVVLVFGRLLLLAREGWLARRRKGR